MSRLKTWSLLSTLFCISGGLAFPQTVAEKMASGSKSSGGVENFELALKDLNEQLSVMKAELKSCYQRAKTLHAEGAEETTFSELLSHVNAIRSQIHTLENRWHESSLQESRKDEEGYALWDQEETTLSQLVMEYGALDYLFIVPPEMATLKLNMHSNIPIPREQWSEMLEIILAHNGIGVKKVNTYVRQLYILKQDPSAIQAIASSPQQLQWIPERTRLFYVFSPPVEQVKSSFQFFERFADTKQTFLYQLGPKIAIVAAKEEIQKLLELYSTIWEESKGKVSRVVPVGKMAVREMEKILTSFFAEAIEKSRPPFGKPEQDGLSIFSLSQGNALILLGQEEVVDRAERIVKDTEEQLQDPAEMTVYLYQCRHSNPDDLAKVLEKVYNSLLVSSTEANKEMEFHFNTQGPQFKNPPDGYPPAAPLVVAPPPLKTGSSASLEMEQGPDHFISDPKTGNLLMVVRRDALIKIKDLLRKLDVPKKMVQIEVMLFEKRIKNENSYGMNMLKLGSKKNGIFYASDLVPKGSGVLQYLLHGHKSKHFPAYDLALNFLMTQEDIQLNAAPSVITVNQTPATISIVEEISINNGAAPVDTNKGIAFEKSFSRAQFGITMILTPTVHVADEEEMDPEGKGFVTLQTNISFDSPQQHHHPEDRPMVHRRHIENEVRVLDGQTIILGGLRRKATMDNEEKVPFLGDIPGIGKLFGSMKLTNHNTEMYIFITPTLVLDPAEELLKIRDLEMSKRPGDIPEYLQRKVEAQEKERKKYFRNSFKALFGNSNV
jgi:general secretion pathway protein D